MSRLVVRDIAPQVRQLTRSSAVSIHVYLIETAHGVVAFDAGIRGSGRWILAAAGGTVARVVLSHGHVEHRGAASELGAPIYCHPDEVEDAEGEGGQQYIDWDLIPATREGLPRLHASWDGGPVSIAATVSEGEQIGSFRVIHVPGHAPGPARVPHPAFNWNTDLARASIHKLRDLGPSSVWTGHGNHLSGEVRGQLETAATATWPEHGGLVGA
ncbi:MAG TPA: MBL fold metallo-hydrolase [Solirubrobacteraceae bacterium]|jgi:glyoxylase-like metal-dependent hydrolase (beta-lactamase superfamily II)